MEILQFSTYKGGTPVSINFELVTHFCGHESGTVIFFNCTDSTGVQKSVVVKESYSEVMSMLEYEEKSKPVSIRKTYLNEE